MHSLDNSEAAFFSEDIAPSRWEYQREVVQDLFEKIRRKDGSVDGGIGVLTGCGRPKVVRPTSCCAPFSMGQLPDSFATGELKLGASIRLALVRC